MLAGRARIAKQTATSLANSLETAGYIERVPDPADGRARLIRLTARGERIIPAARVAEAMIETRWTGQLGRRRMRQLREALELLRPAIDPERG